jgi:hypothetical protein
MQLTKAQRISFVKLDFKFAMKKRLKSTISSLVLIFSPRVTSAYTAYPPLKGLTNLTWSHTLQFWVNHGGSNLVPIVRSDFGCMSANASGKKTPKIFFHTENSYVLLGHDLRTVLLSSLRLKLPLCPRN